MTDEDRAARKHWLGQMHALAIDAHKITDRADRQARAALAALERKIAFLRKMIR